MAGAQPLCGGLTESFPLHNNSRSGYRRATSLVCMRGAGDPLTVGERVAFYRRRRGLAQATLAGLVGRSEDWLSKIERGEREIRRLDVLVEVAKALRVTLGDLLGEPVLLEDEHKNDDVPAIRDALMAPRRLSKTLFGGGFEPEYVDPKPAGVASGTAQGGYHRADSRPRDARAAAPVRLGPARRR